MWVYRLAEHYHVMPAQIREAEEFDVSRMLMLMAADNMAAKEARERLTRK